MMAMSDSPAKRTAFADLAAGSKRPRTRFVGDYDDLLPVIRPWMVVPDFLAYPEDLRAPKQTVKILRLRPLWQAVMKLHPPLTITQKGMETMFQRAADRAGEHVWPRPLTAAELASWKTSIAKQFRTMARHIAQGRGTRWYGKLLDGGDDTLPEDDTVAEDDEHNDSQELLDGESLEEGGLQSGSSGGDVSLLALPPDAAVDVQRGAAKEAVEGAPKKRKKPVTKKPATGPPSAEDNTTYYVGWDHEVGNAFRVDASSQSNGRKEWAHTVEVPAGEQHPVTFFRNGRHNKWLPSRRRRCPRRFPAVPAGKECGARSA